MRYKLLLIIVFTLLVITGCTKNTWTDLTTAASSTTSTIATTGSTGTTATTLLTGKTPTKTPVINSLISDHMILQENKPVRIWGEAEPGVVINVSMVRDNDGVTVGFGQAITDDTGNWLVELPAQKGSFDEYDIMINDSVHTVDIKDVLVGEVWVAAGQSNMEIQLQYIINGSTYLNAANYKYLRIFYQNITPYNNQSADFSYTPVFDVQNGRWVRADSAANVKDCSAIGYVFALTLYKELNMPVGIINTAKGGTSIETWLSREEIEKTPYVENFIKTENRWRTQSNWNDWTNNTNFWEMNYNQMTAMYNEKIAPITNYNIKGFVWYQGENDVFYPYYYYVALTALIDDYSQKFRADNGALPFAIIQLAPNLTVGTDATYYPEFRLRQAEVAEDVPSTRAVIPIHDLSTTWQYGNYYDQQPIHPLDKAPVGIRAADTMLTLLYGNSNDYLAPTYAGYQITNNQITISFNHAESGLLTPSNAPVQTLQIIKKDNTIVNVSGSLYLNQINITYNDISDIQSIVYGYEPNNHNSNVINHFGVPLLPFKITLTS